MLRAVYSYHVRSFSLHIPSGSPNPWQYCTHWSNKTFKRDFSYIHPWFSCDRGFWSGWSSFWIYPRSTRSYRYRTPEIWWEAHGLSGKAWCYCRRIDRAVSDRCCIPESILLSTRESSWWCYHEALWCAGDRFPLIPGFSPHRTAWNRAEKGIHSILDALEEILDCASWAVDRAKIWVIEDEVVHTRRSKRNRGSHHCSISQVLDTRSGSWTYRTRFLALWRAQEYPMNRWFDTTVTVYTVWGIFCAGNL